MTAGVLGLLVLGGFAAVVVGSMAVLVVGLGVAAGRTRPRPPVVPVRRPWHPEPLDDQPAAEIEALARAVLGPDWHDRGGTT